MPKINDDEYNNTQATTGEYVPMGAGGYVGRVQAIRTHGTDYNGRDIDYVAEKQYVVVIYDIDEGDYKGRFSDDYYMKDGRLDPNKDYAHRFYLSWKNLGALKNTLECFDASNPGFDAKAAFDADRWELFIGKQIGLVMGEEEYRANDDSIKTRLRLPSVRTVEAIREGRYRVPALKKLDGGATSTASSSGGKADASIYDDDLPF